GWFNTGIMNTGTRNTGALMSGTDSNGMLWRGDHEGLFGLSYGITIPQFPIRITTTGGIGPIVIPDTTILPPLHLQITGDADYSFTVPDIPIPAIHIGINGVVTVGFTAPEATLLSALKNNGSFISFGPITRSNIDIPPMDFTLGLPVLGPITGQLGPIHLEPIVVAGIGVPLEIEPIPLDAISLSESIPIRIPVDIPASVIDGISMSEVVPIDASVDIPAVTITGTTISAIPLGFDIRTSAGPLNIPIIDIPAAPGFGNSTQMPSSGFFNTGAGGGSGIGNLGAGVSGLLNQAGAGSLVGTLSGLGNAGTLASGVLNSGTAISGLFNVSTLDATTPAVISGFSNLGDHMSGVSIDGLIAILTFPPAESVFDQIIDAAIAELQHLDIGNALALGNVGGVNLGLANVGEFNLGAGNVGNINVGAGNLGGSNLGLGNVGTGNLGFGNIGAGNFGFGN
ncbi:pentapeptide repeat-containing protein, partial [Mycobacterium tuberculosis]